MQKSMVYLIVTLTSVLISGCATSYKPPVDNYCATNSPIYISSGERKCLRIETKRAILKHNEEWGSKCQNQ